jgi:hypothetical protein
VRIDLGDRNDLIENIVGIRRLRLRECAERSRKHDYQAKNSGFLHVKEPPGDLSHYIIAVFAVVSSIKSV